MSAGHGGSSRVDGMGLIPAVRWLSEQAGGDPPAADVLCADPIFVLSAGWRSGSTLVQRMIASDPSVLMWGEPFGDHLPVHRMAAMLEAFDADDRHRANAAASFRGDLSRQWIANLNPGLAALRRAHVAWFETLFAEPARARGHRRWGCKWVRLSAAHAHYLRWLYPRARFVFLVRHPLDALHSYRARRESWYLRRPDLPVRTAHAFLEHWRRTAASFVEEGPDLGALLLRFEDVVGQPGVSKALSGHVGCRIDPEVIEAPIGQSRRPGSVPWSARVEVRLRLGPLLRRLGYQAPGAASLRGEQGR